MEQIEPSENADNSIEISMVIPEYNEEGSLLLLYEKLVEVLEKTGKSFEIIFWDDGSTDSSLRIMQSIEKSDDRVRVFSFRRNRGKAAALQQGFLMANGSIIFTMDADLQDDPEEIPRFIDKIGEGYDLVSGWKTVRHDPLSKTLPSKLFNYVTSLASGIRLHDFNCGFKAYRREVLAEIQLYGDLHRYVPALAHRKGFRVTEIPVRHHPRQYGKSKYGIERFTRGFFDLTTVLLLTRYFRSPMQMFGTTGLFMLLGGTGILAFLTILQIRYGSILGHKPLSVLGVLFLLLGVQFISMGLLAEIIASYGRRQKIEQPSIKKSLPSRDTQSHPLLSVVVPCCNEAEGLDALVTHLSQCLRLLGKPAEIILIDDGSTDSSFDVMTHLHRKFSNVEVIQHRTRFGKPAALQTGFDRASGSLIATMDADFQDNPDHYGQMLEKIEAGNDFVIGERVRVPFPRNITSKLFNRIASFITGFAVPDTNCGLKVFKAEILQDIRPYGELQRFMPALVAAQGYRITSIPIPHQERQYGESKFGWMRIPQGFLNLLTVVVTTTYFRRPLHLFGNIGVIISATGMAINGYLTILRFTTGCIQGHNTLLLVGTVFIVLGIQLWATGLVGELLNKVLNE